MATTAGGIEFEELDGSPRLAYRQEGVTATRRFKVPWALYEAFARECMGTFNAVGQLVDARAAVPFPGVRDTLIADSIDVEPFDDKADGTAVTHLTSGTNSFNNGALVTVAYKQTTSGNLPGNLEVPEYTFLTLETDFSAEYFTPPSRTWKWSASGEDVAGDLTIGLVDPCTTYNVTWHFVASPPWSTISTLVGRVNNATFLGKAAETILFCGLKSQTQWASNTVRPLWNLTYCFKERAHKLVDGTTVVGWNHFYNAKLQGGEHWQLVVSKSGGKRPYEVGNLASLFAYGS